MPIPKTAYDETAAMPYAELPQEQAYCSEWKAGQAAQAQREVVGPVARDAWAELIEE